MDQTIIRNINERVQPKDTLYHLGDFAFARGTDEKAQIQAYRDRINCKSIILILGNHDPHTSTDQPKSWLRDIFTEVYVRMKIKVSHKGETQKVILDHYAGRVWNASHHGVWQIIGHSHYSLPDLSNLYQMDVGIDAVAGRATGHSYETLKSKNLWSELNPSDYRPISLEEIGDFMSAKTLKPIDHHTGNKPVDFSNE